MTKNETLERVRKIITEEIESNQYNANRYEPGEEKNMFWQGAWMGAREILERLEREV